MFDLFSKVLEFLIKKNIVVLKREDGNMINTYHFYTVDDDNFMDARMYRISLIKDCYSLSKDLINLLLLLNVEEMSDKKDRVLVIEALMELRKVENELLFVASAEKVKVKVETVKEELIHIDIPVYNHSKVSHIRNNNKLDKINKALIIVKDIISKYETNEILLKGIKHTLTNEEGQVIREVENDLSNLFKKSYNYSLNIVNTMTNNLDIKKNSFILIIEGIIPSGYRKVF